MQFVFGYITGLITAIFIMVVLSYFRRTIEQKLTVMQKNIENAGPRPQGFIVEPMSDADEVREALIKANSAAGRITRLGDLL
jgi:hypothetical protein